MSHVTAKQSRSLRADAIRRSGLAGLLLFGALLGIASAPIAAQDSNNGLPTAQFTDDGAERCLRCHSGERMTLIAETAHGDTDNPHTPFAQQGCESCHGPGSLHVSRARGGRGFPSLTVFDERDTVERQTAACLGCHSNVMGKLEGMEWTDSAHDTGGITCVSCHAAHIVGNPLTDQERQRTACAGCHAKQIDSHARFEDKGIVFDQLTCYDCHDVHQLISEH